MTWLACESMARPRNKQNVGEITIAMITSKTHSVGLLLSSYYVTIYALCSPSSKYDPHSVFDLLVMRHHEKFLGQVKWKVETGAVVTAT